MKFAEIYGEEIRRLYVDELWSTHMIAEKLNTNAVNISRCLTALGIKPRSRSAAIKNALDSGRLVHPTEGKTRSEETREKMSKGISKAWYDMSAEKKEKVSKDARKRWDKMSKADKDELNHKAHIAIAEAAKNGSKLEKFIALELTKAGYDCFPHKKILENLALEVDLCLPGHMVAIELDGPSHFQPIWGEEAFIKTQNADKEKNGLLNFHGYKVIRLIYTQKHVSTFYKNQALQEILNTLAGIEDKPEKVFRIFV